MSFQVTVRPSGRTFTVEPGETVLAGALRQHVGLPYGCKNGACGSCKGKVLAGQVELGPHQQKALPPEDAVTGHTLFCQAQPLSDLEIESREVQGVGDLPIKKLPCRVIGIRRPAADVAILTLQLPANERLQYLPGQYLEFILKDGTRRSYSIATPPHAEGPLELHIRHMPGGVFTDHVFGAGATQMKERDILRFEAPLGTFFLREKNEQLGLPEVAPIILLASGTGFAPIKAIAEHIFYKGIARPVTLYWGCRSRKDLYLHELAEQWAQDHPGFRYVPVLSDPLPEDGWTGRTGFVHRVLMQDLPDLTGYQVYACGNPVMVESAQRDLTTACRLSSDAFFADSFTSAADLADA
jgi:CDP-4-dehydro-6-deoxyglucose reductase